ncbi:MAG: BLUF domain-containing protein [Janthinobacterium lividum]
MTFSLVYVSRATRTLTGQELLDLMATARTANAAAGITGLLLYDDVGFLQMLEGTRDAVESLYASIEVDPRHEEVTLVRAREQREREFPDWSMAFGAVDNAPLHIVTGAPSPRPTDVEAEFVRELLAVFDPDGTGRAHPSGPSKP